MLTKKLKKKKKKKNSIIGYGLLCEKIHFNPVIWNDTTKETVTVYFFNSQRSAKLNTVTKPKTNKNTVYEQKFYFKSKCVCPFTWLKSIMKTNW